MDSSSRQEENSHQPRESASKRLFTRLRVSKGGERYAAKATPPSCPMPSLSTQLMAAAMGAAPALMPAAMLRWEGRGADYRRDCVLKTLAMELKTTATEVQSV